MRLWTIQPLEVLEQIESEGAVWVDPQRFEYGNGWVPPQYSWLSWQLRGRIDQSLGRLPWFAYCSKPDGRQYRAVGEVRIEFEPPHGQYVSFPIWAWTDIFCGYYLAFDGKQAREWSSRSRRVLGKNYRDHDGLLPESLQIELEASWSRLFSPSLPQRSWHGKRRSFEKEAVVEVIRSEWITDVFKFAKRQRSTSNKAAKDFQ